MIFRSLVLAVVFAVVAICPAAAQKAKDALRYAVSDPIKLLSTYQFPSRDASFFARDIYSTLITYREKDQMFSPALAKSWKRVGPTTLEFDLRDDVTFHNGNKFDADDVVHTLAWIGDPKTKMPFKNVYDWVKAVEKLGPYKVRVESNEVLALDLIRMAYRFEIYDKETQSALRDWSDYGRLAVGTGMYRLARFDDNLGLLLRRNEDYKLGRKAPFGAVAGVPIPDRSTQIAQIMVGGVEAIQDVTPDQMKQLMDNPKLAYSEADGSDMMFFNLDAANRSGVMKPLTDVRVRKAIVMSIDRETIVKTLSPGGPNTKTLPALCRKELMGCDFSIEAYRYDPAEAKRLMIEAGYPNGFDIEIAARPPSEAVAVAMSGYLRAINVRATVQVLPLTVVRKRRGDGSLQAYVGELPASSLPDVSNTVNIMYGPLVNDFWRDQQLRDWMDQGIVEQDLEKRKAIYRRLYDRINEMAYAMPVSTFPDSIIHTKEVAVTLEAENVFSIRLHDLHWAK